MTQLVPPARSHTIALLAASIPLAPDAAQVRSALECNELNWDDVLYLADGHGVTPLLYRLWQRLYARHLEGRGRVYFKALRQHRASGN